MMLLAVELLLRFLLLIAFHLLIFFHAVPFPYIVIPLGLLMIHLLILEKFVDLDLSQISCTVLICTNILVIEFSIGCFCEFHDMLLPEFHVVGVEREVLVVLLLIILSSIIV